MECAPFRRAAAAAVLPALFTLLPAAPARASSAYALEPRLELGLLGTGLLMQAWALRLESERTGGWTDFHRLRSQDVPVYDRWAIDHYDSDLDAYSTLLMNAGIALPVGVSAWETLAGRTRLGLLTDGVLLTEVYLFTSSLAIYFKALGMHPRPLAYNPQAPEPERGSGDAGSSFYSAHTAGAFAAAVFTGYTFQLRHAGDPAVPWVWVASLGVAAGVGGMRIFSGKHFPSDVIAGAVMGAMAGFVVPWMHLKGPGPMSVDLAMAPTSGGAPAPTLVARF